MISFALSPDLPYRARAIQNGSQQLPILPYVALCNQIRLCRITHFSAGGFGENACTEPHAQAHPGAIARQARAMSESDLSGHVRPIRAGPGLPGDAPGYAMIRLGMGPRASVFAETARTKMDNAA